MLKMKEITGKKCMVMRNPDEKEIEPFLIVIKLSDNEYIQVKQTLEQLEAFIQACKKEINDYNKKIETFVINKYLTLKLEYNQTNIYVNGKRFIHCKYLLLNIPKGNIEDFDDIESIDDVSERLDRNLEGRERLKKNLKISPLIEFHGHCSNLQAWAEHGYDTRLLHRNLAFPLLKELSNAGDPLAKRVFKEEIALRLESGELNVIEYLIQGNFFKYFNEEELTSIAENIKDPIAKLITQSQIGDSNLYHKYDHTIKGFRFKEGNISFLSLNKDPVRYNHYKKAMSVYGKISCKLLVGKTLLDFGIQYLDKKIVFPLKFIKFAKDLLKNSEDIQIAIPKGNGPLKLFSKKLNLVVYIMPKKIIL